MKKDREIQEIENTIRTSNGLRDSLFQEIDLLRRGKSNPSKARAVAALASQILQSVKLEIEMHRYVTQHEFEKLPELPDMRLGSNDVGAGA